MAGSRLGRYACVGDTKRPSFQHLGSQKWGKGSGDKVVVAFRVRLGMRLECLVGT